MYHTGFGSVHKLANRVAKKAKLNLGQQRRVQANRERRLAIEELDRGDLQAALGSLAALDDRLDPAVRLENQLPGVRGDAADEKFRRQEPAGGVEAGPTRPPRRACMACTCMSSSRNRRTSCA